MLLLNVNYNLLFLNFYCSPVKKKKKKDDVEVLSFLVDPKLRHSLKKNVLDLYQYYCFIYSEESENVKFTLVYKIYQNDNIEA